ncbi:hypothetical protein ACFFLG_00745 [Shewanella indica]|uniref:hypothetical protein n=1 Tax=Shewanella indica TaxID=768528 RepID=UPI000C32236F|nr:hypothetical protein [Shewanella indica]GHB10773.1 hypothetical protein GCM10007107_24440 [Shewanella indica]
MEGLFQQGWLTGLFLLMFSSFSLASELAYAPRGHLKWMTATGKMVEPGAMNGKLKADKDKCEF